MYLTIRIVLFVEVAGRRGSAYLVQPAASLLLTRDLFYVYAVLVMSKARPCARKKVASCQQQSDDLRWVNRSQNVW